MCVSIQFAALESSKRYFARSNVARGQGGPDGKTLTLPQLAAAGAFAGITNGFVSGPVEHIRIRELIRLSYPIPLTLHSVRTTDTIG